MFGNTARREFLDWLASHGRMPEYAVVAFFVRREIEERQALHPSPPSIADHLIDMVRPSPASPDPWDSSHSGTEAGWRRRLNELKSAGLIEECLDRVDLTAEGRADVESRHQAAATALAAWERAEANRPKQRNAAARDAVVRWLYSRPSYVGTQAELGAVRAADIYAGDPLVAAEVAAAVQYLAECGLVAASVDVEQYRLTRKGIDCAERFDGSVSQYEQEGRGEDRSVTVHGSVSNLMRDNASGKQEATTNITFTGPSTADLVTLIRAIGEAVPVLGLPPDVAGRLTRDVEVVEAELVDEGGNQGIVGTLLGSGSGYPRRDSQQFIGVDPRRICQGTGPQAGNPDRVVEGAGPRFQRMATGPVQAGVRGCSPARGDAAYSSHSSYEVAASTSSDSPSTHVTLTRPGWPGTGETLSTATHSRWFVCGFSRR